MMDSVEEKLGKEVGNPSVFAFFPCLLFSFQLRMIHIHLCKSRKKRQCFFSSGSNNPGRPQTAQSSELKDHKGGSRVFPSVLTLSLSNCIR